MQQDPSSGGDNSLSPGDPEQRLSATQSGVISYFRSFWSAILKLYRNAGIIAWSERYSILTATFVLIGVEIWLFRFGDPAVMRWLDSWRTKDISELASWLSFLGEFHVVPLGLVFGIWIWSEKTLRLDGRIALGATLIAMALSGALVQIPKFIFGRPRPHFNLPDQFAWFHPEWNSFPSGHATHWFALVGALWAFSPRLCLMVTPLAIIASLARVVAFAHYPSDIIAGVAFGLFFGLFFGFSARTINGNRNRSNGLE